MSKVRGISKDLGGLASLIGSAVAKTVKAKKQKPAKKKKSLGIMTTGVTRPSYSMAPTAIGSVVRSMTSKHTPFVVEGRSFAGLVANNTAGTFTGVLNFQGLPTSYCQSFNVDPIANGNFPLNFQFFPTTINTIATSFLRWRIRKLRLNYVPSCTTTTAGSIAISSVPEVVTTNTNHSYGTVASCQNSLLTTVWVPSSMDLIAQGGLRNEWLICDSSSASSEANERQITAGAVCVSGLGCPSGLSQVFGSLFIEYSLEFDGLATNSDFNATLPKVDPRPSTSEPSFSSSSSSNYNPNLASGPLLNQTSEDESDLTQSVHVSASLLQSLGLKKAY